MLSNMMGGIENIVHFVFQDCFSLSGPSVLKQTKLSQSRFLAFFFPFICKVLRIPTSVTSSAVMGWGRLLCEKASLNSSHYLSLVKD